LYAKTSQNTDRLVFTFTAPYTIAEEESISIKVPDASYFVGDNTPNSLYCIFQPTHEAKTSLGVGLIATSCEYDNGVFDITPPKGGLTTQEYTLSILEKNQIVTEFSMPDTPQRLEISLIYVDGLNQKKGDTYVLDFPGHFDTFTVNHLSLRYSSYNMIGFTINPSFDLPAASLVSPISESVIEVELSSKYFSSCLGVDSLFSSDGMTFESGTYFSHYSSPAVSDSNTRLFCGQYSESYAPVKLRVTDYGTMSNSNNYYFRFPLIQNPGSSNTPLIYRVRLLRYNNNEHYPTIISEYEYHNLQQIVTGSSSSQYVYLSTSNEYVQNNLGLSFTYNSYYPSSGTELLLKFKNNEI
jgi:hypothetical protein